MSSPATPSTPPTPLPVARQPIWSRDGSLFAHELLYRAHDGSAVGVDHWQVAEQDRATASVLAALEHGEPCLREGRAFVNVTRSFVVDDLPLPAAHPGLVLEIVETVPADDEVLAGLRRLRDAGHAIALDDFAAEAHQVALLPFAHYVKIDCRELVQHGSALVDLARRDGAVLVAEHVSDGHILETCLQLGFELLQGDALGAATVAPPR